MVVRGSVAQVPRTAARWAGAAVWVLLLSPVALIPGGLFRFALPELTVAALGILLAARAPAAGRLPRSMTVLIAAGGLLLLLAVALSAAPVAQLVGRWPRYEGLVALPVYLGAAWAGARVLGPGAHPTSRRALTAAASVSAVAIGAVSAAEAAGLRPLGGDVARPGSVLGNASDQGVAAAILLAIVLPALPWAWRTMRRPPAAGPTGRGAAILTVLGAFAASSTLLLSGSRGAFVAAIVAHLVQVLVTARDARHRGPTVVAGAMVLIVLAAAAITTPQMSSRLLAGDGPAADSVHGRALLWSATARVVAEHPWTGVGPSGLVDALPDVATQDWALSTDADHPPVSPHDWALQAAAAGGIPLLLVALGLVVAVAVHGRRRLSEAREPGVADDPYVPTAALGAVVAAAVALTVHPTGSATVVLAATMTGALVAGRESGVELRSPVRAVASILAGLWVVGLALGSAAEVPLGQAAARAADGDVLGAEAAVHQAMRLRPWDPDLHLIAAQIYLAGSNAGHVPSAEAARQHAELALAATPASLEAARIDATALITLGRPEQAREELTHLLARSPFDARLLLARGVASATLADWTAAERDLLAASRYAPSDAVVWQNLAHLYAVTDRAALARDAADRATRLAP